MTREDRTIDFPPFRLDLRRERLWRGDRPVDLRPKAWRLLRYLSERPGQLVSREELLDAVWDDVEVTVASLNQAILELRRALGDDAREPRFIETVHRRGFRFIAGTEGHAETGIAPGGQADAGEAVRPGLIGRDRELAALHGFLARARTGRRQVVFVTGEAGIGKSSLLRGFLRSLEGEAAGASIFVGGGQCVQFLGESEAYLPVLDALDRLTREPHGARLREVLRTYAPTWIAQMPWLAQADAPGDPDALPGTPARMLRELCAAMEALAAERPTILWIEDLHWSDPATVDLLGALARRPEASRLLVVATYRPVDAAVADHPIAPLKRALQHSGLGHEMALELLEPEDVARVVEGRFGRLDHCPELSQIIHGHTDGNPLFVENTAEFLSSEGLVVEAEGGWKVSASLDAIDERLPESLRGVVDSQLHGMADEEVRALEAASVVGATVDIQAVAAALGADEVETESICGRLADWGRFLKAAGSSRWPDGSEGGRYRFLHDVFRQILYDRTRPSLRQRMHREAGLRIEAGFEGQHPRVAAELALHFERGGDPERAIGYLSQAGEGVQRRFADREAVHYFQHALDLLRTFPDAENHDRREADLRRRLARALIHASGYSSGAQKGNLERLIELGRDLGDPVNEAAGTVYLKDWHVLRSELADAQGIELSPPTPSGSLEMTVLEAQFQVSSGLASMLRGDHPLSLNQFAAALEGLEGVNPAEIARIVELDLVVGCHSVPAWSTWLSGRPDEARRRERLARERRGDLSGDWFGLAVLLSFALVVEVWRRDHLAVGALVRELAECLDESGLGWPYTLGAVGEGWWLTMEGRGDEGLERLRRGIVEAETAGTVLGLSQLHATIAWAEMQRGRIDAGLSAIHAAKEFVDRTGERFWEAEIHRLRGELLRGAGDQPRAESSFQEALDVARLQGALSLELRAATSLAALWRAEDRGAEARLLLSGVYERFTEGFDTRDLDDARALLESL